MARIFPSDAPMRNLGEFSGPGTAWRTVWGLCRVAHVGPGEFKKNHQTGPQQRGYRRLKNFAQMSLEGIERHTLACSHFFTGQARPFHCWGPGAPQGPPRFRYGASRRSAIADAGTGQGKRGGGPLFQPPWSPFQAPGRLCWRTVPQSGQICVRCCDQSLPWLVTGSVMASGRQRYS